MSSNMQRLGNVLSTQMKKTSHAAVPTTIELGVINANLSLTPDSLQANIPKGDYMVNLMLTGSRSTSSESHTHSGGTHGGHEAGNGSHTHSGGEHSHELSSAFRGIQAGDRVLIAWCGNEPVVIAIVGTSTVLTFSEGGSSGSGSTGSGSTGQDGKDGFSPTVLVTPITGGNRITITDVNGPQTFDVMNGTTPVKGKDYFTEAEVKGIVDDVVKQVTKIFEEKFYTKGEINTMFENIVVSDEEFKAFLGEVFGE